MTMEPDPIPDPPKAHMDADSAIADLASLRALAGRLVEDPHEAEDVAREALEATAAKGAKVKNPLSYARGVVRIRALRKRREASDRRYHEERRAGSTPEADLGSPDDALQRVELMRLVLEEIGRLPTAQSSAVALRYLEGRSVDEIARLEQKQPSTIRAHISRGLAAVRESLDRRLGGRESWSLVLAPWALGPGYVVGAGAAGHAVNAAEPAVRSGASAASSSSTGVATGTLLTVLKASLVAAPLIGTGLMLGLRDDDSEAETRTVAGAERIVAAGAPEPAASPDASDATADWRPARVPAAAPAASAEAASPAAFPFQGRVLDAAGRGAAGIEVVVLQPAAADDAEGAAPYVQTRRGRVVPSGIRATTDASGAFSTDALLPAGPLWVRFNDTHSARILEAASEPVEFPFAADLETSIQPAIRLGFSGEVPVEGATVVATPRQPGGSPTAVVSGSGPYVRFADPVAEDTRFLDFVVEEDFLAASVRVGPDLGRSDDALEVEFQPCGRAHFQIDGLVGSMQVFVAMDPVDEAARGLIARFDGEGLARADHVLPGRYRWSCRMGDVQQEGDVLIAARETARIQLEPLTSVGGDASVLIDASAAPDVDLGDGRWIAMAVDANNPAAGFRVDLVRRGAADDGLWHARVADLPAGDWILGLKPRDGYTVTSNLAPMRAGETTGPILVTPAAESSMITLRVVDAASGDLLPSARVWVFDGMMGDSPVGDRGVFADVPVPGSNGSAVFAQADGHELQRFELDAAELKGAATLALRAGSRTRVWVVDMARQGGAEGVEVVIDGVPAGRTDERGELWFDAEQRPERITVGPNAPELEVMVDPFELGMGDTLMTPGYLFVVKRP